MGDYVLLDERHLSFDIPNDLDDAACDAIQPIVESRPFRVALRRAIGEVVRPDPERAPVRIRLAV
jgi:hypothetical protein